MKIVFLDIDGVLTTISTKWQTFHPDCVKALKRVLETTGAKVVLSSSWRHGFIDWRTEDHCLVQPKDVLKVMQELLTEAGLPSDCLIDKTPTCKFQEGIDERGNEIDTWLKNHACIESFVILDDDNDMKPHMDRWVQTCWGDGMNEEHADKAISLLSKNV